MEITFTYPPQDIAQDLLDRLDFSNIHFQSDYAVQSLVALPSPVGIVVTIELEHESGPFCSKQDLLEDAMSQLNLEEPHGLWKRKETERRNQ